MLGKSGSTIKKHRQSTMTSFFKRVITPASQSSQQSDPFVAQANNETVPIVPAIDIESDEDLSRKPGVKRARGKENVIESDDDEPAKPAYPAKKHNLLSSDLNLDQSPVTFTPKSRAAFTPSARSEITPSRSAGPTPTSRAAKFKEKNEDRYSWLSSPTDLNKNSPDHEDYDPRTLFIPKHAWNEFTPFEKQFWEIKSAHWDTVVFFKKGKFFELYENDAGTFSPDLDIGHQQFDLKLTDRVNMRMVGVPESSFHHWASQFIAKGHKVAKVEQMENAMGKAIRDKASVSKKDDKIIRRELTSILTTGTLVDSGFLTSDQSTYCMSIKEVQATPNTLPVFGISFVDTATAEFNLVYFTDDLDRTQFETLITQTKPMELVLEKGMLSKVALKILKNNLENPLYNYLTPEIEFWSSEITLDHLQHGSYFKVDGQENIDENDQSNWPTALQSITENSVALSAFGGLVSYLRSLKLDQPLVSAKNINLYDPVKSSSSLILDGQTLMNLEIFNNSYDDSDKGSLFKLLNHCSTPFGKRLFKKWMCHPLRSIQAINARMDASDDLYAISDEMDTLQIVLRKLPDLERVIARIHSGNCMVKDFVGCLASFKTVQNILVTLSNHASEFKSTRLADMVRQGYPAELIESLEYFDNAFDHADAMSSGKLQLFEGYDSVFDAHRDVVKSIEDKLNSYRKECEKEIGAKIAFRDIGKEVYQMEVATKTKAPTSWTVISKTQALNRYYNQHLQTMINDLLEAKEHCEAAMREIKTRTYQTFSENYAKWKRVIVDLSEIDCLMGLALCRKNLSEPVCRPEFIESVESILELEELRHPCVLETITSGEYIPNDLLLTGSKDSMVLLTGPNMGGKSTLLRQTCVAVIMAQMGCYVPAVKCRLTVVDRIFTRIGANDNIMAGQSTFMVELSETSKILKEATNRSLLGRGTSTYDGYAVAYASLHYLVSNVGCLGLFSTHYGALTSEFQDNPLVALKFMSFFVDEDSQQVTFLYKLATGKCPESYGMNVARMAKLPESIILTAEAVSRQFDEKNTFKIAA